MTGVLTAQQAGAGEQLWDWAWSESIGWVSFRNDNTNAHWPIVSDDNFATYVFTNGNSWGKDAFKMEDQPVGTAGNINQLCIRVRHMGDAIMGFRLNSSESWTGTDFSNNMGWFNWQCFATRPGGGAWTWNDVENVQAIVNIRRNIAVQGRLSEVYVEVDYTGGTLSLQPNGTGDYTEIPNPSGVVAPFGYGVEANRTTGALSGYVWSSNIGWISFEPVSVAGCPTAPCQAYIDFDTAEVFGWARVCTVFSAGCSGALKANRGGWDGWIRFSGLLYSAELNDTSNPSEFFNWAWGDNKVVGWLSLNKINTGGPIDYKVKTNLKLNAPPVAAFNCIPASCQVYRGQILLLDNISTDPDGNDQIDLCEWSWDDLTDVAGYSLFSSCSPPPDPNLCDTTFGSVRGNWNVKLYVEDEKGAFSEAVRQVTVLRDIVASFECSLDDINWYSCTDSDNISPIEGETLYLIDTSVASETSFGVSAVVNNWTWLINGVNIGAGNKSQIDISTEVPMMTIKLTVRDTNGHSDDVTEILYGIMPLPRWREIAPF